MKICKVINFLFKIIILLFIVENFEKVKSIDNPNKIVIDDLNDSNFDIKINDGLENSWFILFYIDSCPHCKNAKSSLENISKNSNLLSESNIKIGKLDCNSNMFSCYRFKITKVPYMIIIDKNYMHELNEYPSKENIMNFIKKKKDKEQGLKIPLSVGYIEFFYKSLEEIVQLLNNTIENYLKNNLKIEIIWRSEYTIFLLASLLILIIVLEYLILSIICKIPNNNNEDELISKEKDNNKELEENKNKMTDDKIKKEQ